MPKLLKNTTGSPINLTKFGIVVPANNTYIVQHQDYLLLSSTDVFDQLDEYLVNGSIVVNDGIDDLDYTNGKNFLRYPDTAFGIRFLATPQRANGRIYKNLQQAVEESLGTALANDRYSFPCNYGGNANVGRYLELFPAVDTSIAPFIFPEDSTIITVTLGTDNSSGAFTIGFFKRSDLVTPVFTVSMPDGQRTATFQNLNYSFLELDELAIRVTSGSRIKPYIMVWVNTIGV